jgi:hypothetical protein
MDIEACLRRIEEHLKDGDMTEAKFAIADADTWLDKGGSITPDQFTRLRACKTELTRRRLAKLESTD